MILSLLVCFGTISGFINGAAFYFNEAKALSDIDYSGYVSEVPHAAPSESDNPNYIIYPTNPGHPGNFSNELTMAGYFSHLYTHFPVNKKGSCGFVALSQVLSYFDTFYNDSIIPEQYESKSSIDSNNFGTFSPGTLQDSLITPFVSTMSSQQFANDTYYECFDSKLMVDYNENTDWYFHQTNTNIPDVPLLEGGYQISFINSVTWADTSFIVDSMYGQYGLETGIHFGMTINNDPINNASQFRIETNEVRNQMEDEWDQDEFDEIMSEMSYSMVEDVASVIDDGFPVILSITQRYDQEQVYENGILRCKYTGVGNHAVVAYDYEIEQGKIVLYCNFGHEANTIYAPYNNHPFKYVWAYVPVRHNSSIHNHSDNYLIDDKIFCGCGHHSHSLEYRYVNNQKHSVYCHCGYLQYENHSDPFNYSCCSGNLPINPGVA